jgi:hypothetical protein
VIPEEVNHQLKPVHSLTVYPLPHSLPGPPPEALILLNVWPTPADRTHAELRSMFQDDSRDAVLAEVWMIAASARLLPGTAGNSYTELVWQKP